MRRQIQREDGRRQDAMKRLAMVSRGASFISCDGADNVEFAITDGSARASVKFRHDITFSRQDAINWALDAIEDLDAALQSPDGLKDLRHRLENARSALANCYNFMSGDVDEDVERLADELYGDGVYLKTGNRNQR